MTTYSFRAECSVDVKNFFLLCKNKQIAYTKVHAENDGIRPDVHMQFNTNADLETVRSVMREVVDGHVMLQTLRAVALNENNMSRDYDLL